MAYAHALRSPGVAWLLGTSMVGRLPVAMTGLAGIALLMEGDVGKQSRFGASAPKPGKPRNLAEVRKAADWLMEQSQPRRDGLIFSDHPSETARYIEGHGLATIFLGKSDAAK